jgi:Zn-dependent peptidase ImmA (M78 family)
MAEVTSKSDVEREANGFAEILRPVPAVRSGWEERGDVVACAAHFDVSPTAMQWRLYGFGLVAEGPQA